jgi:hypothetical protein
MNFAAALARGRVDGVHIDLAGLLSGETDRALVEQAKEVLLAGGASMNTLEVIHKRIAQEHRLDDKRRYAVAMALGSPDFQKQ